MTTFRLSPAVASSIIFFYLLFAFLEARLFDPPYTAFMASGVEIGLLFVFGLRYAPLVFAGSLLGTVVTETPALFTVLLPFAHMAQAMFGAWLLSKLRFNILFNTLRDALTVLFVSLSVSAILPTCIAILEYGQQFFGSPMSLGLTWGTWWVATASNIFILMPLTVRWLGKPRLHPRTPLQVAEATACVLAIAAVAFNVFWTPLQSIDGLPIVYLLGIPFFLLAFRSGPRFMTLGIATLALVAFSGALFGSGELFPEASNKIFQTQLLIDAIALFFYSLVTVQEERKDALKQAEGQLLELNTALAELRAQDRLRSEFLAVLAHELRNPLAPLLSSMELLFLENRANAAERRELQVMETQVSRMRRLLDDLLDIARITQQKLHLQLAPIALQAVIEHSVQSVQPVIDARDQRLLVSVPSERLYVEGDAARLEQACINLLRNASKFSTKGARVELSLMKTNATGTISIRDEGVGIDPENMGDIFEPFRQIRPTEEAKNDGLGIGLTLVKTIVDLHGGRVEAKSLGKGTGSTFTVHLPLVSEPKTAPQPLFSPPAEKRKVLIVDDNTAAADSLVSLLKIKGYQAFAAYDGSSAEEALAECPDVVFLDIGLPDTDGYSVARKMRGSKRFAGKLIALSGYGQEEDKQKSKEAGFDAHLTKPVGINELLAVL